MQTFSFKISVPATSQKQAENKAKALAKLGRDLEPTSLIALAKQAKSILEDPIKGPLVRGQLGL